MLVSFEEFLDFFILKTILSGRKRMSKVRRRRPKRVMMEAINAKLAGQKKESDRIIKEHGLDVSEIDARIELREGKPYDLKSGPRPTAKKRAGRKRSRSRKRKSAGRPRRTPAIPHIEENSSTITLLQLEQQIRSLLARRPKGEVSRGRQVLAKVDEHRAKFEEAEAQLKAMQ